METIQNFDNHGSGYASYILCSLYHKNNLFYSNTTPTINSLKLRHQHKDSFVGGNSAPELQAKSGVVNEISANILTLTINRHIPIAILGVGEFSETLLNGKVSHGMLPGMTIEQNQQVLGQCQKEVARIKHLLQIYGIALIEDLELLTQFFDTDYSRFEQFTYTCRSSIPRIIDHLFYEID